MYDGAAASVHTIEIGEAVVVLAQRSIRVFVLSIRAESSKESSAISLR
jgi:hypothetical protein